MQTLQQIWDWFNGKKTNIGASLLIGATVLIKVTAIWHIHGDWIQPTVDTLEYIGGSFAVVGLGHQAVK